MVTATEAVVTAREVFESTMFHLSSLDAWILTVLKCFISEENRGGKRQKIYVDTFQNFRPIAMGQLSHKLYNFGKQ